MDKRAGARLLMLPVENNKGSEQAAQWTLQNMYKSGDRLLLLHVVSHSNAVYSGVFLPPTAEQVEQRALLAEAAIRERIGAIADAAGAPYELCVIKAGGAADDIGALVCRKAADAGAAAMVMAAHNKGAAARFFVGSVTTYCVMHACTPVVIVHVDR